jgi:Protein of unknown function (DUF2844)
MPIDRWIRLWSVGIALVGPAAAAYAGLGEPREHLEEDRTALQSAPIVVAHTGAYDRHTLQTARGITVHEYTDRAGTVFAVSFVGPAMPDLKVLLGERYAEYAAKAHASPSTHKVYTHTSRTLQLSIVKLPRGFTGTALVPDGVPPGVDPRDLH